jgi:multidrug efflux pump subunit AcrB
VKVGAAQEDDKKSVVIALTHRGDYGREALRGWSQAVVERLTADGVLVKPEVFPGPDEKQTGLVRIDRASCARLGLAEADVHKAVRTAGPAVKIDALKKRTVTNAKGDKVPLKAVATFKEVIVPAAVYRMHLYEAVRITGSPPDPMSGATAYLDVVATLVCAALAPQVAHPVRRASPVLMQITLPFCVPT